MGRLDSGDYKIIFGTNLCTLGFGLMKYGRARWQEAEATRKNQYCTDSSGQEILYLRALHGHSGCNSIDPSLQDNVLILFLLSSSTFHILDVQSVYIPSQIQD